MNGPTVGVLALQGDVREHVAALTALGAEVIEVRTEAQLDAVDGLVLPGGESTALGIMIASSGLRRPIEERLAAGMPAFGTCAGMILLAREVVDGRPDQTSLGAINLSVRRNAFGSQAASFEVDLDVAGLDGGPLHAVFIRAPVVEQSGPGVEVLARIDDRPVLARQGPVLACAFHPELVGDLRLHELFLTMITEV
ncbi:MAG TPA: pyridoxal 5'-phosphate synthase glutaminase subunit PdxT [Acidimicrobiales bacterium]|nr:pyridoxal 5'-phosphate synthase glutaminase subunit PdxT [Acidimicrobiales bacterium]